MQDKHCTMQPDDTVSMAIGG